MENRIEKFRKSLPPEVRNIIDEVIKTELEKLYLGKPRGIKDEIKQIIHKEITQRET